LYPVEFGVGIFLPAKNSFDSIRQSFLKEKMIGIIENVRQKPNT